MTNDHSDNAVNPASPEREEAGRELDAMTDFVAASTRVVARLRQLPDGPAIRATADGLYEVSRRLLTANENLAGWRHRFLQFTFRGDDATGRFLALVAEYRTRRAGRDFHEMKYRSGDIGVIYERNIKAVLGDALPDDTDLRTEMQQALDDLGASDAGMVTFIYDTVLEDIDEFVLTAEPFVDDHDFNGAEVARLEFKARSADLSNRLEILGNQLSDLVLQYARVAQRPVEFD